LVYICRIEKDFSYHSVFIFILT